MPSQPNCTHARGQKMADEWCNLPAQSGCGACTGRVARHSGGLGDPSPAWRCYCTECLTHNLSSYNLSTHCKQYCTDPGRPGELEGIVERCQLPAPAPAPAPPGSCTSSYWAEPTLLYAPSEGTLVLTYTRIDLLTGGCDSNEQEEVGLFRTVSTDVGLSWSTPRRPTLLGAPSTCLTPTGGLVIRQGPSAGRQLYFLPRESYGGEVVAYTDDPNASVWRVSTGLYTPGLDEANVAQARDGSLFAVMRNCFTAGGGVAHGCSLASLASVGPSAHRVATAISTDSGATWSNATLHSDLVTPTCQSSLIGYNGALYFVGPYSETSRTNLTVLASDDNGQTFSRGLVLVPTGGSGYSAIACGLAGALDCAVLYDTDAGSLKFLKFDSRALS